MTALRPRAAAPPLPGRRSAGGATPDRRPVVVPGRAPAGPVACLAAGPQAARPPVTGPGSPGPQDAGPAAACPSAAAGQPGAGARWPEGRA